MFILYLDGIRFLPNFRFWLFGSSYKSLCNWNVRDWRELNWWILKVRTFFLDQGTKINFGEIFVKILLLPYGSA